MGKYLKKIVGEDEQRRQTKESKSKLKEGKIEDDDDDLWLKGERGDDVDRS